ncbi:MAG: Ig-like domain-containing protein [Acidobacteriota bacterium]
MRRADAVAAGAAALLALVAVSAATAQPHPVDAGWRHAVAVRGDGTVWAWGRNADGQLGSGSPLPADGRCDGVSSAVPVQVITADGSPLVDVVAVAAGQDQSAAVDAAGTVWTWGRTEDGRLGDGAPPDSAAPCRPWAAPVVDAAGRPLADVVAVDSGFEHTVALRRDGTAWAWGGGGSGQLGDGFGRDRAYAVRVVDENFTPLQNLVDVDAGRRFSVALDADGAVWAWGSDEHGQLGDNGDASAAIDWALPVRRIGNLPLPPIRRIAAGRDFALAVDRDGGFWAWGNNGDGQLGDGTRDGSVQAKPIPLPFSHAIAQIAAGQDHAFALTVGGELWAWGDNTYGQLGGRPEGSPFLSLIPIPALDAAGEPLAGLRAITAGRYAGFALHRDSSSVLSWGIDDDELLGRPVPSGPGYDHRPLPVLGADGEPFLLGTATADPVLTVVKRGDGDGDVLSAPAGIDCPAGCAEAVARFDAGARVEVRASEAPGSDFTGFSGGCQGQTCDLTLTHDEVVYAHFEVEPPLAVVSTEPVDGRVGVDLEAPVALLFNRPVVPGPGDPGIALRAPDAAESHPVNLEADPDEPARWRVRPLEPLRTGVEYVLEWPRDAAVDDEGAALPEDFELRFTTRAAASAFLSLGMRKPSIVEGDDQTAWVWLDRTAEVDRTVQLFTEPPGAFDLPPTVVIAAGEVGTPVPLTPLDVDGDQTVRLHAAEVGAAPAVLEIPVMDLEPVAGEGFDYRGCALLGQHFDDGNYDSVFDAGETWDLGIQLANTTGAGVDFQSLCFQALDFGQHELLEPDPCDLGLPLITAELYTHPTPVWMHRDLASDSYHVRIEGIAADVPSFVGHCAFDISNGEPVDYSWLRSSGPDNVFDAGETVRIAYVTPGRLENGADEPPPPVRFWLEDTSGAALWQRTSWANPWVHDWTYVLEFAAPDGPASFTLRSEIHPLPSPIDEPNRDNNEARPFTFATRRPNAAPVPAPIPADLAVEVEQTFELPIDFFDADGDVLSFRLLEAPDGAELDAAPPDRAVVRWTPALDQGPNSAVAFEIEADDAFRGVVTVPFEVEVTYVADLEVSVAGPAAGRGEPWTGTVTVRNRSTARVRAAGVVVTVDAALEDPAWTCTPDDGASCRPAGDGAPVDGTLELPGGSGVTYSITGRVAATATALAVTAALDHPPPYTDPEPGNDAASLEVPAFEPGALIFYDGFEDGVGCRWGAVHGADFGCAPGAPDL